MDHSEIRTFSIGSIAKARELAEKGAVSFDVAPLLKYALADIDKLSTMFQEGNPLSEEEALAKLRQTAEFYKGVLSEKHFKLWCLHVLPQLANLHGINVEVIDEQVT